MQVDCILVGGGLANTLIALRLASQVPRPRLRIVERGPNLGGNHTWCFHGPDVTARDLGWLAPFVVQSWEDQEVAFDGFGRVLRTSYHAISSERLHAVATECLGDDVLLGTEAITVGATSVRLSNGTTIESRCVIDGRGLPDTTEWSLGYQKFVGLEVSLSEPCGQRRPIIMDATVAQTDGFRFVYTLPFTPSRLLIEDTCYSNSPSIDVPQLETQILAYAQNKGWRIADVRRREIGVLPVVLSGEVEPLLSATIRSGPALAGSRAALFHPTTAYSLPDAVRLAARIAAQPHPTTRTVARLVASTSRSAWRCRAFYRLLNRLLLQAAEPHQRARVMQRFYAMPEPLIQRFYADRLTTADKARILVGKPPISIASALKVVRDRKPNAGEITYG